MSFSRINKGLGGSSGGGGGGLTDAQTDSLENVSLGDVDDFTGVIPNYYQFGVPIGQSSGTYACTTYSASSSGLTLTTSTADSVFEGSNLSKAVGFYRLAFGGDLDVAIDVSNLDNMPNQTGNKWHVLICICEGGTARKNAMFAARLERSGGNTETWKVGRCIAPQYVKKFEDSDGFTDEITLAEKPTAIRLRVERSNSQTGYKAYYSLNAGASYTTIEGSDGGTGYFQMQPSDSPSFNQADRYSIGGPLYVIVGCGQNADKATASKSDQQGTCKVAFKDLS